MISHIFAFLQNKKTAVLPEIFGREKIRGFVSGVGVKVQVNLQVGKNRPLDACVTEGIFKISKLQIANLFALFYYKNYNVSF